MLDPRTYATRCFSARDSLLPHTHAQVCIDILEAAGIEVDCKSKVPPAELKKIIGEYDGLIVRSGTMVTAVFTTQLLDC